MGTDHARQVQCGIGFFGIFFQRKSDNGRPRRWRGPSGGSECWKTGDYATIPELAEREDIARNRCYCFIGPYWPKEVEA